MSDLLPQHERLLIASAIAPAVAAARGYRSITSRAELAQLGFEDYQRRIPALLIPVHDVLGRVAAYQIRPDAPRMNGGKPVKYETPTGSRLVLDVPPAVRPRLGDPTIPLVITEGAKKADAAVSAGLCAIGIAGVWGWRGTNEKGGTTVLPDFESIALNGRTVLPVFDSDLVSNPKVRAALERLRSLLESRGGRVAVVYLPAGTDGAKVGLDDWLAAGGTPERLMQLAAQDNMVSDPLVCSVAEYLRERGSRNEPEPVVPFFVFAGRMTVLAAREKTGKSTLLTAAATAVSRGWPFLGVPVRAGDVLLWSLEEHPDDLAARLEDFGADLDRVFFSKRPPRDPLAELEEWSQQRSFDLIGVDSLIKAASGRVKDMSKSGELQPVLDRLLAIPRLTGAGMLVSAHSPKSPAELYRDSTAIGAVPDAVIGMRRGAEERVREFEVQARWPSGKFAIRLVGDVGSEENMPDFELVSGAELNPYAKLIVHVTKSPGCSRTAAVKAVGGRKQDNLKRIKDLLERGALEEKDGGLFPGKEVARGRLNGGKRGGSRAGTTPSEESPSGSRLSVRDTTPEPLSGTTDSGTGSRPPP